MTIFVRPGVPVPFGPFFFKACLKCFHVFSDGFLGITLHTAVDRGVDLQAGIPQVDASLATVGH